MRLRFLLPLLLLVFATETHGQTIVLTDTSRATWTPSPDNDRQAGVPAAPVVTSYRAEVWLRANVTGNVPQGPPVQTLDWGKPAIVSGAQTGPILKPLITVQGELVVFLRAVGPGGVSALSNASSPFGLAAGPPAPAAPSAVSFTP